MPNMTMSVPENMHERMRKHSDVKWTEVARKAFENKLEKLEQNEKRTKDVARTYALKHALDDWDDADELIKQ
jgi:predicted GIY-YIG superfamily endonuclease